MKTLIAACALLGLLINPALAANEQQDKMATCNKDATGKKGDERKAFMKECLSSKPASAAPAAAPAPEAPAAAGNSQQNKMATCNKEATGKKGDERKAFMKECLSNKPAAPAAAPAPAPAPAAAPAAPAAGNSQQNKMATCNKEATGKKGDERKAFMSECLKAK
jgi:hypothetical protein